MLARIRLTGVLAAVLVPLLAAAPAHAASKRFYIRGAGYGHGVGMSQYGAYGYALQGRDAPFILGHYYTGTKIDQTASGQVVRVILRSISGGSMSFTGARRAGTRTVSPEKTYTVARGANGQVVLRSPGGRTLKAFDPPMRGRRPARRPRPRRRASRRPPSSSPAAATATASG